MAAGVDVDVGLLREFGRDPVMAPRMFRQGGQRVQLRQRRGAVGQRAHVLGQYVQQLFEQPFFSGQRTVLRRQHLVFPGLELRRDVAFGVLERLAAAVVFRHLGGLALGDFDVEAMHAVEFHAQIADAGALAFACFQLDQEIAAVGRQSAQFIQFRIEARRQHAAVADGHGGLRRDGADQQGGQRGIHRQVRNQLAQPGRIRHRFEQVA
ncbi:hypothetical protein D3C86_837010 [compost metagenome]